MIIKFMITEVDFIIYILYTSLAKFINMTVNDSIYIIKYCLISLLWGSIAVYKGETQSANTYWTLTSSSAFCFLLCKLFHLAP